MNSINNDDGVGVGGWIRGQFFKYLNTSFLGV